MDQPASWASSGSPGTSAGGAAPSCSKTPAQSQDNIVSGDWFVIAGSGTGQLAGLRGEGGFRAKLGESAQVHLDYWFE